jgi:hypothetical protein
MLNSEAKEIPPTTLKLVDLCAVSPHTEHEKRARFGPLFKLFHALIRRGKKN